MHLPSSRSIHRQRGAALLTAMIIVTLVATLAAAMVWQQWRSVQVEGAERARTQAAWILSGALDFADRILREDAKSSIGVRMTALTEPWATPLAESRLSTFLAADKANSDDGPEAFLSGKIVDAQSRYNLLNLLDATKKAVDPKQLTVLVRLCEAAHVDESVAQRIANGLREAVYGNGEDQPILPQSVAQLTWLGIDEASVRALEPYVLVIPAVPPLFVQSQINVNTAPPEVLAAVTGIDPGSAARLAQTRTRTPFETPKQFTDQAPESDGSGIVVRSNYFDVYARLRLLDRVLVERSLVLRIGPTTPSRVLTRERVSSIDPSSP